MVKKAADIYTPAYCSTTQSIGDRLHNLGGHRVPHNFLHNFYHTDTPKMNRSNFTAWRDSEGADVLFTTSTAGARFHKEHIFAGIIMLLAIILRTSNLGCQSVWNDEYVCVAYLDAPTWSDFQAGYTQHDRYMPPVYHALLYAWAKSIGSDALSLRLLSELISVASLCLVYTLGIALLGKRWAWAALALFAFSPQQIYHAQGIRCYSLLVFFALLSALSFLRMLRGGGMSWWIVNATINSVLVWTHLGSLLLVLTWGMGILLWLRRYRGRIAVWLSIHLLFITPLVGIALLTTRFLTASGATKTALMQPIMLCVVLIAPFFKDSSYLLDALPSEYAGGIGVLTAWQSGFRFFLIGLAFLLVILFAFVTIHTCWLAILGALKSRKEADSTHLLTRHAYLPDESNRQEAPRIVGFLLLWFLVPAFLLYLPVCMVNYSAVVPRYTIFSSPALHLLAVYGALLLYNQRRRRLVLFSMIACMMILGIGTVFLPLRANYLALGRLLATDENRHPIAAMGDSALLVSQIAYNGRLEEETIIQVYSAHELDTWLEKTMSANTRAWIVLEGGPGLEKMNDMLSIEQLLTERELKHTRHLFHGPIVLLAYDISQGERTILGE